MSRQGRPQGQRQLRVGEELRHALARILERGEVHDPVLATLAITVTEVRISPDLRQATVFVMPLGGREEASAVAALTRAAGFLKRRIAKTVYLRFVPELTFRVDRSFEQSDRIARILRDPAVARDIRPDRNQDESGDGQGG